MRTYLANITGATLLIGSLCAQKPTGGTVTAEVALNGAINDINIGLVQGARFRYFLGDNLALRLGLGINSESRTTVVYRNDNPSAEKGTEVLKSSSFDFLPGAEFHFPGGEKLSTFAGAYLLLGFSNASTSRTDCERDGDGRLRYQPDYTRTIQGEADYSTDTRRRTHHKSNSVGLGFYTGFDWYFVQNLYLGVELRLQFTSTSYPNVIDKATQRIGNVTTTVERVRGGGKSSDFAVESIGALRLGYQF